QILQAVLETAQEDIGLGQTITGLLLQKTALSQARQYRTGRLDLQLLVAAAAYQLEDLRHKLDLAYAARAELDVVGHVLAFDLAAYLRVQLAHGVDGAVIEVLAEHEGAADRFQLILL